MVRPNVQFIPVWIAFCLLASLSVSAPGQQETSSSPGPESAGAQSAPTTLSTSRDLMTPKIRQAITRGHEFLKGRQMNSGQIGGEYPVAETSLATLALVAGGSTPRRGPYRNAIRNGLKYVMSQARGRNTFITGPAGKSRMHGHGFALLMLAELYGSFELPTDVDPDEVREIIKSSIRTTRYAQTKLGGWGYKPRPNEGDEASVTITQIQALRAARNAGIKVDSSTIDRAIEYIKKSHDGNGRFMYSLSQNRKRYSFALTAAAISTLNYTGVYQNSPGSRSPELSEMIQEGLEYMDNNVPSPDDRWYHYGLFYAAQAHYFAGNETWRNWYKRFADDLVELQKENGAWESDISRVYGTSLCLLILQIPYKYLPIFQK